MVVYLADTSIWAWANRDPGSELTRRLAERVARDEIATCPPVVLESMHRAKDGEAFERLYERRFALLRSFPVTERSGQRAIQVQRELASGTHGNHRRPAADLLIAAAAEEAGADVILWFIDQDLRVICEHTGQPYEDEPKP
jgi:predicted nucleic acid-binding protein